MVYSVMATTGTKSRRGQGQDLLRTTARPKAAMLVVLAVATGTAGCSYEERICSEGEYPVVNSGTFDGGACVANGKEPPKGYVRYPAHKVPVYLEDDYQPTWRDYLKYGDAQQRKQAEMHVD